MTGYVVTAKSACRSFVKASDKALYRRWLPFGMLTSHSRCHGAPPKEPWLYDREFTDFFRYTVEFKYRLMPYIMAESITAASKGWPMVRPLFFHYPDDRTSWFVEDEYLFGHDILAASIFSEDADTRDVYLPPGCWVDIQTDAAYAGGAWHTVSGGRLMMPVFVREGAVIPLVEPAGNTSKIDWNSINLFVCVGAGGSCGFSNNDSPAAVSYHPDFGLYSIDTVTCRAIGAETISCRKVYSLVESVM
jgi:alpha-D-xyloside xylohydrolase